MRMENAHCSVSFAALDKRRRRILDVLNSERFVDQAPLEV
jgi:hypothetical protein